MIEDWMHFRNEGPYSEVNLHLEKKPYDHHAWSKALWDAGRQKAFETMECHISRFVGDAELDALAEFGINALRVPVGYWLFDDEQLYPQDPWVANMSGSPPYGVNPDGYVTPGTLPLSDLVVKAHNRNMKVIIDMHANPGCSSAKQSHAGILCEAEPPNLWDGKPEDGISGSGYKVRRAKDGKTWAEVMRKIALERVVPWIKFIDAIAPGTIVAYAPANEPDSPPVPSHDATWQQLRALSLDIGKDVSECLGDLASRVQIGISTGVQNGNNYVAKDVAADYQRPDYASMKGLYLSDVHHYYAWTGCAQGNTFSVQCVCESNLPGSQFQYDDRVWADFMRSGILKKGWGMYVGEWSVGLGQANPCHGSLPSAAEAQAMWRAQKWSYISQYLHYKGHGPDGSHSSFVGDFYWNARLGRNWNPDPEVCFGPSTSEHYQKNDVWDWSLLRLIKLGLAEPLSKMGFAPDKLSAKKAAVCKGSFPTGCKQPGAAAPVAPARPQKDPKPDAADLPKSWWAPGGAAETVQASGLPARLPAGAAAERPLLASAATFCMLCASVAAAVFAVRRLRLGAGGSQRSLEVQEEEPLVA